MVTQQTVDTASRRHGAGVRQGSAQDYSSAQIGHLLRAWRHKYELTTRSAGRLIGISSATLSRIERGGDMDTRTMLRLIAFLFGGCYGR